MFKAKFSANFFKAISFALGCAALTVALDPSSIAQVTNPGVQQKGSVTAGHCAQWSGLSQIQDSGGTCAGLAPVQSVFGRTGNVVAAANDYNFNQLAGSLACGQMPALTGDLTSSACATTLATVNSNVGSFGSATRSVTFTVNAKGLITAASDSLITPAFSSLTGSLACSQMPALTGDVTASAGTCATTIAAGAVTAGKLASGAAASNLGSAGGDLTGTYPSPTLAAILSAGGPTGSATVTPIITYDAKGRLTAVSSATITPPFSALTGQATLAQLPTMAANTVLSNWTSGSATPLANVWPSCANDGSHALVYVNGSGLACATLGSGGTVTSVQVAAGTGINVSGTCTITTSGVCTVTTNLSTASNILGSDVQINSASVYVTGPSMAQGTSGTWNVEGKVTVVDTVGTATVTCKLWDGTTIISSGYISASTNFGAAVVLQGQITNPAGNIRISCISTETNANIKFNASGLSKDSYVWGTRIN